MLYTIGDLHLSRTVKKPMDIFGARWNGHNEKIEENWRRKITAEDTVVIPGDISWAMTLEEARADFDFIESLPGKKIMLKGNHDYYWQTKKKLCDFISSCGYETMTFLQNDAVETEDFIICGSRGWYNDDKENLARGADNRKIIAREVVRLKMSIDAAKKLRDAAAERGEKKEILAFLHFPAIFKGYMCDEIIMELYRGGIERCYYGHIHGNYDAPAKINYADIDFYLVSADYLLFDPLAIQKNVDIASK